MRWQLLSREALDDLYNSGLDNSYIDLMGIRPHLGNSGPSFPEGYSPEGVLREQPLPQVPSQKQEAAATGNQKLNVNYQIPYFHLDGRLNPDFFRIKLLNSPSEPIARSPKAGPGSSASSSSSSSSSSTPAKRPEAKRPKYLQSNDEANHIYIPPNWLELSFRPFIANRSDKFARAMSDTLIITEGEKKAASLAMIGFLALGLGGIDSWRTSRIEAREADVLKVDKANKRLVLNADNLLDRLREGVAPEFSDSALISAIRPKNIFIIFDSEPQVALSSLPPAQQLEAAPHYNGKYSKDQVSRAAFELAIYLSSKGCDNVSLAELPRPQNFSTGVGVYKKFAVDDAVYQYLRLDKLSHQQACEKFLDFLYPPTDKLPLGWRCTEVDQALFTPHSFPSINNVRAWIDNKLNNPARLGRSDRLKIARAIVSHLDSNGKRYQDIEETNKYYYFHNHTRILHSIDTLSQSDSKTIIRSGFGDFVSRNYNLLSSDSAVVSDVIDQIMHIKGVSEVQAYKLLHSDKDSIYYQLSNTYFVKISANSIEVRPNGYGGVLFTEMEIELSEPEIIKLTEILSAKAEGRELYKPRPKWEDAINSMNLQPIAGLSLEETRKFLLALFYINPWLNRWRGTMMPMELAIAEPGSGKSMLYNLRQGILVGRGKLSGTPLSLRDWYSSIASSGGMWVGDNFGAIPRQIGDALSDELARLITDPHPSIDLRKLYTNNESFVSPVRCSFAVTAINNPFVNEDILQRSILFNMKAIPVGARDGNWFSRQLDGESRLDWLADHIYTLHKFLVRVEQKWSDSFLSKHRLANFEQCLLLMGETLDFDFLTLNSISRSLVSAVAANISGSNVVVASLLEFRHEWLARHPKTKKFTTQEIVFWAQGNPDFSNIKTLTNGRYLGKYIQQHSYDIESVVGMVETEGLIGNRKTYLFKPLEGSS